MRDTKTTTQLNKKQDEGLKNNNTAQLKTRWGTQKTTTQLNKKQDEGHKKQQQQLN